MNSQRKMENKFKVTEHVLVPKHTKLTKQQAEAFLKKHNYKKEHLPFILITDPAIRHLNPEEGDIIRIERNSPTMGKVYFYRVVVRA